GPRGLCRPTKRRQLPPRRPARHQTNPHSADAYPHSFLRREGMQEPCLFVSGRALSGTASRGSPCCDLLLFGQLAGRAYFGCHRASLSSCATISGAVRPPASAAKLITMRWVSTVGAT